jgi:signal transduction histidine kinase
MAAAALAAGALLVVLVVLQLLWTERLRTAEEERMRRHIDITLERVADDFDREISRAFFVFQIAAGSPEKTAQSLAAAWRNWQETAWVPEVVSEIYYLSTDESGVVARFEPTTDTLHASVDLPPALAEAIAQAKRARAQPSRARLLPEPPALMIDVRRPPGSRTSSVAGRRRRADDLEAGSLIVLFSRSALSSGLLARVSGTHLGTEQDEVVLSVFDPRDPLTPVFSTSPPLAQTTGDASRPIFSVRFFPELRGSAPPRGVLADELRQRREGRGQRGRWRPPPIDPDARGAWELVAMRREGSVAIAATRLRRRNLSLGLGIVILLGATTAALLRSLQATRSLVARQMDLVTGVTHELNTPLAAIQSAAANLADGVVEEPARVRDYGEVIGAEARRLGGLVTHVLDFAGTSAASLQRERERVDLAELVATTLDDFRWTIEQNEIEVELNLEPAPPAVEVEPEAVRRALHNVLGNALKYGAAGGWLGVEIESGDREVQLRIADRGPGIARAERQRIFEPFERGREVAASHVHGSGLGLAVARRLVEEQGGSLELLETQGKGASFCIRFPIASTAPSQEASRDA